MKKIRVLVLLVVSLLVVMPVQAKHRSHHDPIKDAKESMMDSIMSSLKGAFQFITNELKEQTKVGKLLGDAIDKKGAKIDDLTASWADDLSRDVSRTFDSKLHHYVTSEMDKYKNIRHMYGNRDSSEAAYQYALVTEISKQDAKETDRKLKNHAKNIKSLSEKNSKTEDLKSSQDLANQHSTEQSILLADLLNEQSKINRQLAANHEYELQELNRKAEFHDLGSK